MDRNKDYSYLVGKEFELVVSDGSITGKIAEIDPWIGVTAVRAADKKNYLFCFNGEMSAKQDEEDKEHFEECFDYIVKAVESGKVEISEFNKILGHGQTGLLGPDSSICAFT